tara:strand:+ start:485 stop:1360 length:876 start_codon:yes stop_codon:yes gene_type:complete
MEVLNLNCTGDEVRLEKEVALRRNPYYNISETKNNTAKILSGMNRLIDSKIKSEGNLVVKFDPKCLNVPEIMDGLKQYELRVVVTYRRNVLDLATCFVRDWIGCPQPRYHGDKDERRTAQRSHTLGHLSVNASTGGQSHLCFQRRYFPDGAIMAKYNISTLTRYIRQFMNRQYKYDKSALEVGISGGVSSLLAVAAEDLSAYEFQPINVASLSPSDRMQDSLARMNLSIHSWKTLLDQFGVQSDNNIIREVLESHGKDSRTLKPHSKSIYNADEVLEELKLNHLDHYFRPG